jgi:hypothetical protein
MATTLFQLLPQGALPVIPGLKDPPLTPGAVPATATLQSVGIPTATITCMADHRPPKIFYVSPSGATSEITLDLAQQKELGKLYSELKELLKTRASDVSIDLDKLIANMDGDDLFFEMTPDVHVKIQELREFIKTKVYKNKDLIWPVFEPGERVERNGAYSFGAVTKKEPFPKEILGMDLWKNKRYEVAEGIRKFLLDNVTDKLVPDAKTLEGQSRKAAIARVQELLKGVDSWAVCYAATHPLDILLQDSKDVRKQKVEAYMNAAKQHLPKEMKDEMKKAYLEDLVRLHCADRAEYTLTSNILDALHRQDGPELFLFRLTDAIVNKSSADNVMNGPASLHVLGPLNEVDRSEVRNKLATFVQSL